MFSLIILAGGFGTRLDSISKGKPKSLMPVGNSVYLDLLLDKVFKFRIKHVYLSLHYEAQIFQEYLKSSLHKKNISTIIEPVPLGTGGAIKYVLENSNLSSPFFVINGDTISDTNLDEMLDDFLIKKLIAMIAVSKVENSDRYGTVLHKGGRVLSFQEKGALGPSWVNNGHYVFSKEAFGYNDNAFSLENDLFPLLIKDKELGLFKVVDDNFIDMGIPEDYHRLCNDYMESK